MPPSFAGTCPPLVIVTSTPAVMADVCSIFQSCDCIGKLRLPPNAYLTMHDDTIVHYYMGDSYSPDSYSGIRYNDSMFSIEWPYDPQIISEKDLNIPDYLGK